MQSRQRQARQGMAQEIEHGKEELPGQPSGSQGRLFNVFSNKEKK